eukprot:TRINITY_DN1798_c0_g1_i1.p1 TRINITY_DN1798_c0_g1~~TRINITY_DN1798_c0_g1_i1.p1  ORF type:complete len:416 (-),score=72.11 TRINITY_DN1798_c0_g1_i1:1252-2316(-)
MTTVMASKKFTEDRLWVNGADHPLTGRVKRVLTVLRERADPEWQEYGIHICSENNFPTAAGLASSASGFACMVFSLAKLLNVSEAYQGELSSFARQGSGSACRSLYGGFVKWEMGVDTKTGRDSIAVQVAPETHWPELEIMILVASDAKKHVASTTGMETTVLTSSLLKHRASHDVPDRMARMEAAIAARDFEAFGKITMQDSNSFHAVCLDTYPPIFYLNDTSRAVIHLVHQYNAYHGSIKVAYTFDAGPNAVIYAPRENIKSFLQTVMYYFPPTADTSADFASPAVLEAAGLDSAISAKSISRTLEQAIGMQQRPGALKKIYHSKVGDGPRMMQPSDSLLNTITGVPNKKAA